MASLKRTVPFVVAGLLLAVSASAASASTVVGIDLWDKGANMEMPADLVYGTPGVDMSKATIDRPPSSGPVAMLV